MALFGIGVASALLPPLSRAFAAGDTKKMETLLEFALSNTLLVILPCTVAIFCIGGASVNLIYGRGDFTNFSAIETTYCLWGYGIGLLPMVITVLLAPAFYAKKDYKTPMICSLFSIGSGLIMNSILICFFHLGPSTLAFSTSVSSYINAYLLYRALFSKAGVQFSPVFYRSSLKTALCSIIAGLVTFYIGFSYLNDPAFSMIWGGDPVFIRGWSEQSFQFCVLFAVFSSAFVLSAFVFKREEVFALFKWVQKIN